MRRITTPFTPRLDFLEDRCLMAAKLFAMGSPTGESPWVILFEYDHGQLVRQFQPFSSHFTGGVRVALSDLNQDGQDDLIVAAGPGFFASLFQMLSVFPDLSFYWGNSEPGRIHIAIERFYPFTCSIPLFNIYPKQTLDQ